MIKHEICLNKYLILFGKLKFSSFHGKIDEDIENVLLLFFHNYFFLFLVCSPVFWLHEPLPIKWMAF